MSNNIRNLILIIIVSAIALWVILPNNPGIHLGSFNRDIKTYLGLDLVGGVQVLLEADVPADQAVSSDALNTARQIVENRVNGLGVSEAVVTRVGDRRISVELPGLEDPEQAIKTLRGTGLLEFVDMSSVSQNEAITLVGLPITTDYTTSDQNAVTDAITSTNTLLNTVWPTVTAF